HADRGETRLQSFVAQLLHLGPRRFGAKQRVVDQTRQGAHVWGQADRVRARRGRFGIVWTFRITDLTHDLGTDRGHQVFEFSLSQGFRFQTVDSLGCAKPARLAIVGTARARQYPSSVTGPTLFGDARDRSSYKLAIVA